MEEPTLSLLQLNRLISRLVTVEATQNVWITAELSDVQVRKGHCYMELLQKDETDGAQLAKARAIIWANLYPRLAAQFLEATGQRFASGMEVMLRVSATYHPVFGMSLVINDINPEFTMGDLLRRRNESLKRLKQEGILDLNRQLPWPLFPSRVAIITSPDAAGFGDFRKKLFTSPARLRFSVDLFPATMQGASAPQSIIDALYAIGEEADRWDCVVITRGGGATSDLQAFEDYDLAATIAQFPIPVIIGLGHDRDVTLLDYVANKRVITPTDAAQTLIDFGNNLLGRLDSLAHAIHHTAASLISGAKEQLSYCEAILPVAPLNALTAAHNRLNRNVLALNNISAKRITPALARLDLMAESIPAYIDRAIAAQRRTLDERARLLEALSPQAVLRRGYSITRLNGHAITSADKAAPGDTIETILATGTITSEITKTEK